MQSLKLIITGATGMVGEGVLFECLQNPHVSEILLISRKHYAIDHPKVQQLLVKDFSRLSDHAHKLDGFNACFFCAGVSSIGMVEEAYRKITYDTTLSFARALLAQNSNMVFTYVSGSHTDSTEKGRLMWARVKGRTENDLAKLPFNGVYNFRPGVMLPFEGQKNWKNTYKWLAKAIRLVAPKSVLTLHELGLAMIAVAMNGYPSTVLEIKDIRSAAASLQTAS